MWSKTEAGRQEIKVRSQVPGRSQRTLLLLIDGKRDVAELLASVSGTSSADLDALAALGLIVAVDPTEVAQPMSMPQAGPLASAPAVVAPPGNAAPAAGSAVPDWQDTRSGYVDLSSALTETIARELGLRGFVLTMAVERAATLDELRAVAERTINAVADRKGLAQGRAVRRALFGE